MKQYELATYRGYPLQIDQHDIVVHSPDGQHMGCFSSMVSVRKWVREHRKSLRTQEAKGGDGCSSTGAAQSPVVLPPRLVVLAKPFD